MCDLKLLEADVVHATDATVSSVWKIAKVLCNWLGVAFRPSMESSILNGETLLLSEKGHFWGVTEKGMMQKSEKDATFFTVTSESAKLMHPICTGKLVWLETSHGRQLTWKKRPRLCQAKDRYNKLNAWKVTKVTKTDDENDENTNMKLGDLGDLITLTPSGAKDETLPLKVHLVRSRAMERREQHLLDLVRQALPLKGKKSSKCLKIV